MKNFKIPTQVVGEVMNQFQLASGLKMVIKGGAAKAIAAKAAKINGNVSFLEGAPLLSRLWPIQDLDGWVVKVEEGLDWDEAGDLGDMATMTKLPKPKNFPAMWEGPLQTRSGIDCPMAKLYILLDTSSLQATAYYSDSFAWDLTPLYLEEDTILVGPDSKVGREKRWQRLLLKEKFNWFEENRKRLTEYYRFNTNWNISNQFRKEFEKYNPNSESAIAFFYDLKEAIITDDDDHFYRYVDRTYDELYSLWYNMDRDYFDPRKKLSRYLAFSWRYAMPLDEKLLNEYYWIGDSIISILHYAFHKSKERERFAIYISENINKFKDEKVQKEIKQYIDWYLIKDDPYWDKGKEWDKNNGW